MNTKSHARTARDSICNPSGLLQLDFLRLGEQVLREEYQTCENEVASIRQELANMERSRLRIHKDWKGFHFGFIPEGSSQEKGISRDPDRIHLLARRDYLERKLDIMEARLKRCSRIIDSTTEAHDEHRLLARLRRYEDVSLDLCRIIFTREQNEWIDEPYTPNPFYPEHLTCPTNGGIMTRSKSEAFIGNWAESVGLPYRYDDLVRIVNYDPSAQPNKTNYFADFKFPNFCSGITVHEHLGSFHKKNYADNGLDRLNDYHNFTVFELPNQAVHYNEFTWSFESDLRDRKLFQYLVRRILLPGEI